MTGTIPGALAAVVVLIAGVSAQSPPATTLPPPQVEKTFAPGGSIYMDLSAGGYVVEPTSDSRIRIRWSVKDASDARSVLATAEVTGTDARIVIAGPKNGFSARVDVPGRSNLTVSLSAGDFALGALEGDKDVSAWAGKIAIAVPNPADYYSVQASVTAGQIRAEPFHADKGGLFRSFTWEGKGRHSLRVRLTAGDIILQGADAAPPSL